MTRHDVRIPQRIGRIPARAGFWNPGRCVSDCRGCRIGGRLSCECRCQRKRIDEQRMTGQRNGVEASGRQLSIAVRSLRIRGNHIRCLRCVFLFRRCIAVSNFKRFLGPLRTSSRRCTRHGTAAAGIERLGAFISGHGCREFASNGTPRITGRTTLRSHRSHRSRQLRRGRQRHPLLGRGSLPSGHSINMLGTAAGERRGEGLIRSSRRFTLREFWGHQPRPGDLSVSCRCAARRCGPRSAHAAHRSTSRRGRSRLGSRKGIQRLCSLCGMPGTLSGMFDGSSQRNGPRPHCIQRNSPLRNRDRRFHRLPTLLSRGERTSGYSRPLLCSKIVSCLPISCQRPRIPCRPRRSEWRSRAGTSRNQLNFPVVAALRIRPEERTMWKQQTRKQQRKCTGSPPEPQQAVCCHDYPPMPNAPGPFAAPAAAVPPSESFDKRKNAAASIH